jgi:hypothetical protein
MANASQDENPDPQVSPPSDPYEFPGDGALKDLSEPDQIEALKEWFLWNFEDPAQNTPYESAEGGYIWIWGGPYDARDELFNRFGGVLFDSVVEEAAKEIEREGWDWAPHSRRVGPPEEFDDQPPTADEAEARAEMLTRLQRLEDAVNEMRGASSRIGHNNPPEPIDDLPLNAAQQDQIISDIRFIQNECKAPEPNAGEVEAAANRFRDLASKIGMWAAKKCDLALDELAKAFGSSLGKIIALGISAPVAVALLKLMGALTAAEIAVHAWLSYLTLPF